WGTINGRRNLHQQSDFPDYRSTGSIRVRVLEGISVISYLTETLRLSTLVQRGPQRTRGFRILFSQVSLMTSFEEISERERRFLIQTYDRYPVAIERDKGVILYE